MPFGECTRNVKAAFRRYMVSAASAQTYHKDLICCKIKTSNKMERRGLMSFLLLILTIVLVDLGIKSAIEDADTSEFPREL